ncbi:MAG: hypothetical protein ACXVDE_07495 [Tumebacillaceae bacterium]
MKRRFLKFLQMGLLLSVVCAPLHALAQPADQLTPAEHQQLEKLTQLSGGTIQINWDEKRGTPSYISGRLSKPLKGEPYEMALTFLDSVKELYHVDKPKKSFQLKRVDQDELGMKHVRLTHMVNNIPVWGDELIVHVDKNNVVRSINGPFTADVEKNTERIGEPKIDSATAIKNAQAEVQISQPSAKPTAALYYFPYPDPDTVTLTYIVSVQDESAPADWKVFVDAVTGDVVHKYNDIKFKRSHGEVKKLEPGEKKKR